MNDRPFTLQPRSAPSQAPQSISEFIQRLNAEPGGFRDVKSADLRREIGADRNGDDPGDHDVDMAGDTSEADADADDAETKDVPAARDELLRAIHQAHQTSMFALDFVSLLLSKENPAQAVTTFSPGLRDMVGIGTLGATILEAPTVIAQRRVPDNKMVGIGKRLMDLTKAADAALAASKRLQREIMLERKYWSMVLGVSEDGWQTFRLPHEPHTMGVKFGFSNAAPEFKESGIAPMRRAKDGSVFLEHGLMGRGSKRLQVKILENGVVVGKSSLPRPLPPDAPLQDRAKEARDTVFAQELWHEINREIRADLVSLVRVEESTATYDLDPTRTVCVQLVTLGEEEEATAEDPAPQDAMANELCLILGLLLSNAHRANELKRSGPGINKAASPPYSILRPLIAHYKYDQSVQKCAESLSALVSVLRSAGLAASLTMQEPPLSPPAGNTTPASTSLANLLVKPPTVQFDLTITPASRIRIQLKPTPVSGAVYSVSLLQPLPQQPGASVNPLLALCPPSAEDYADLEIFLAYLHYTIPCALTAAYYELVFAVAAAAPSPIESTWAMDASSNGIVDLETGGEYGVHFGFGRDKESGQLEVSVEGHFLENGGTKVHRAWRWPGAEETLSAVVKHVLSNGPSE
jgi:mediator of RNA polymerase II transcription subunit 17